MAIHKLDIDEFDEIDYCLIAIHTSLEDYRLAYFINQQLPINLSKCNNGIQINTKKGTTSFSRFYFDDEEKLISWSLIQNHNEISWKEENTKQDLFSENSQELSAKVFLIPEMKKVDYFLKIETNGSQEELVTIIDKLKAVKNIAALYSVAVQTIKSKNNLIF